MVERRCTLICGAPRTQPPPRAPCTHLVEDLKPVSLEHAHQLRLARAVHALQTQHQQHTDTRVIGGTFALQELALQGCELTLTCW
jgi:hypothetical protein